MYEAKSGTTALILSCPGLGKQCMTNLASPCYGFKAYAELLPYMQLMSAWIWVGLAGMFEIAWAIGLKMSDGFRRPGVSALTVAGMIVSFILLSQGMRRLPAGTAYAVWTGIGSAGTALGGIWLLGESASAARLACLGMIVAGIVGLKLCGE